MFTGLYPIQHRLTRNGLALAEDYQTVGEIAGANGFATAAFVGSNAHFVGARLDRGFAAFDEPRTFGFQAYRRANETADLAIRWLEGRERGDRFFLFLHFYDVHPPLTPPSIHIEAVERGEAEQRRPLLRFFAERHRIPMTAFRGDDDALLALMSASDAEIRFVDAELRRIYQAFRDLEISDRTLWIVTSDHGEGLGNHNWLRHGKHIYDEQVRVPLVFHALDDSLRRRRVSAIVEHIDLLPTLAGFFGVGEATASGGEPLLGRSLARFLLGDPPETPRAAFVQRRSFRNASSKSRGFEPGEKFGLVESKWKYIYRSVGPDELYNLREDPYETNNLARTREARRLEMRERLLARAAQLAGDAPREAERVDSENRGRLEALGYIE